MSGRDGGPAFPNITPDMNVDGGPGMSLRDWFAGQALAGMIASAEGEASGGWPGGDAQCARACYSLADAMLKAREAE